MPCQVVDCRRILKWTYAFGYYNFDESVKSKFSSTVLKQQQEFFEFNQVSLRPTHQLINDY